MYATRLVQLLVVAVSVLCMAHAMLWDSPRINLRALAQRDDASAADSSLPSAPVPDLPSPSPSSSPSPSPSQSPESSSPADASTSAPAPAPATTSAPAPSPSSQSTEDSSPNTSSENAPAASSAPSTPASTSAHEDSDASSAPSNPTPAAEPTSTKPANGGGGSGGDSNTTPAQATATPVVTTEIQIITKTNGDGSKVTQTTTNLVTSTAALNPGDSSQTSGMSTKTRNTIIGVVVGVGGAVVLGALGLVAFRIWGRKKYAEENDGLMDYGADINHDGEKSERGGSAGGQRNPFQATLENYHQPTPVNASSNF